MDTKQASKEKKERGGKRGNKSLKGQKNKEEDKWLNELDQDQR